MTKNNYIQGLQRQIEELTKELEKAKEKHNTVDCEECKRLRILMEKYKRRVR